MPSVSVIVPIYNVEPFLCRCIDSILAQTYSDYELILVDDGSQDSCGEICEEYAKSDDRIHVIHQKHYGPSAARNAGIDWAFSNSDSQWISFIDSDDYVHPRFLEHLFRGVQENNVKICCCSFLRTEEYWFPEEIEYSSEIQEWDQFYISDPSRAVVVWNKIYAKSLFQILRFPIGKLHEDEFISYRILHSAGMLAVLNEVLYCYYQNPNGIMNSQYSLARLDAIEAIEEQCKFAKQIGNEVFYISRLQRSVIWLSDHFFKVAQMPDISEKDRKRILNRLRKQLRKAIQILSFSAPVDFIQNKWVYQIAYPRLMWLYWMFTAVKKKVQRGIRKEL